MFKFILLMGLPRSGKSTLASKLAKRYGGVIVSPDSVQVALATNNQTNFVWAILDTMFTSLMVTKHRLIILDATNFSRKKRDVWKSKALDHQYKTRVLFINTPVQKCLERASESSMEYLLPKITKMNEKIYTTRAMDFDDISYTYNGERNLPTRFLDTLFR